MTFDWSDYIEGAVKGTPDFFNNTPALPRISYHHHLKLPERTEIRQKYETRGFTIVFYDEHIMRLRREHPSKFLDSGDIAFLDFPSISYVLTGDFMFSILNSYKHVVMRG